MRKFLLIFACAFSFCVRAETNGVYWTQEQWEAFKNWMSDGFWYSSSYSGSSDVWADGRVRDSSGESFFWQMPYDLGMAIGQIPRILHLFMTGDIGDAYDVSSNNVLAYASSLREYLNSSTNSLYRIDDEVHWYLPKIWERQLATAAPIQGLYNDRFYAGNKVIELTNLSSNNFDRLYAVITNLNLQVSISNQIEISNIVSGGMREITAQQEWTRDNIQSEMWNWRDNMNRNHGELMEFLHTMSNSVLFASNVFNSCCGMNSNNQEAVSNYQDSVLAMLAWMTNSWADLAPADPTVGFGDSNTVWSVWRPGDSGFADLLIPNLEWYQEQDGWHASYKPRDEQYDMQFNSIAHRYDDLLRDYNAGDIEGQQFFAGLVDLQLHILAKMSTQLYMIDEKMPTKTNLWAWIEQYKSEVQERVAEAQAENSEAASTASALLDYTPFSIVGGHFPKVSSALNSLRVDNDAPPVVRIPIPRALRVSDSDELVVDVRDSDWFVTGRNWCRWIFTFIWGWLFIRMGLVPIFYIFFFTVRVAEISAHLVFMGSVRGSSGVVSSFGASAVDMVLSLIGIDTDFKKFVWGIMRD